MPFAQTKAYNIRPLSFDVVHTLCLWSTVSKFDFHLADDFVSSISKMFVQDISHRNSFNNVECPLRLLKELCSLLSRMHSTMSATLTIYLHMNECKNCLWEPEETCSRSQVFVCAGLILLILCYTFLHVMCRIGGRLRIRLSRQCGDHVSSSSCYISFRQSATPIKNESNRRGRCTGTSLTKRTDRTAIATAVQQQLHQKP